MSWSAPERRGQYQASMQDTLDNVREWRPIQCTVSLRRHNNAAAALDRYRACTCILCRQDKALVSSVVIRAVSGSRYSRYTSGPSKTKNMNYKLMYASAFINLFNSFSPHIHICQQYASKCLFTLLDVSKFDAVNSSHKKTIVYVQVLSGAGASTQGGIEATASWLSFRGDKFPMGHTATVAMQLKLLIYCKFTLSVFKTYR